MQNSNADAYRTVRNAVPDADAGSVVRCCMVPHLKYGTGARADARIQTSVRIRVSILKPVPPLILKLNVKYERIHSKVGADPHFSFKNSCLNFSKASVCDANPDPDS